MQTEKFNELPLNQKIRIVQGCALFPALAIMVFMRRRVGYRVLKPTWLLILATILNTLAVLSPSETNTTRGVIFLYVLVMLGLGLYQRHIRWGEICRGVRWHTWCSGISYFENLPLPRFLRANRTLYRVLDPVACGLIGLIIQREFSMVLGTWIIFSATALCVFEQACYENQIDNDLNTLDGLVEAELHSDVVKQFEKGAQSDDGRSHLEETAGVATGLAPDIQRQIAQRKAKLGLTPMNLVQNTRQLENSVTL